MAELKTRKNRADINDFLATIEDQQKMQDCQSLVRLMREVSGKKPNMWGSSIIGFGSYHYRYESGHEGDSFLCGFAPRKQALAIYIMAGFSRYPDLMQKLGKYKTGKSCLYIKKLSDVDNAVLKELVARSVAYMRANYDCG